MNDLIPERAAQWIEEDNIVVLLKPKIKTRIIRKWMIKPDYRIKLDSYGSFVWKSIDGNRSVEDIGKMLKESFGDSVEPLYERLCEFISILRENGLIKLKN